MPKTVSYQIDTLTFISFLLSFVEKLEKKTEPPYDEPSYFCHAQSQIRFKMKKSFYTYSCC